MPGYTTITATKIKDASGHALAAGRVYFSGPVNPQGEPVSAIAGGGGGLITQTPVAFLVVNGAITTDLYGGTPQVADTALTDPEDICYRITVTDASGQEVQGPGYDLAQPRGTTWSLDTYVPIQPLLTTIARGPAGPSGGGYYAVDEVFTGPSSITVTHNLGILNPVVQGNVTAGPKGGVPLWWPVPIDANNTAIVSMGPMSISLAFLGGTSSGGGSPAAPVVTTNPGAQSGYIGSSVSFTSAATGSPGPTVQWQKSTDGGSTWTDIGGATSGTYSFTATLAENGYKYRAVWTNSAGTATSTAATLAVDVISPAGLVRFWKMNEGSGSSFADASVDGDTAAATGVTWGTTGQDGFTGKPALFDGSTSFALGGSSTDTNFDGSTPFSMSVWFNSSSLVSERVFLSTMDLSVAAIPGWGFETSGDTLWVTLISNVSGNWIRVQTGGGLSTGALHHAVFTYDGSKTAAGIKIYRDGALMTGNTVLSDSLTGSIANPVAPLIGAYRNGSAKAALFQGGLGYARIYSRVLASGEVTNLNTAGPA